MYYVEKVIDNSQIYIRDTKDNVLECYTLQDLKSIFINFNVTIEGFRGTSVVECTCFNLMNKNSLIGEFCISSDLKYSDFYSYSNLLPLDYSDIGSWIKTRRVFTCARNIKEFFNSLGISSDIDFIRIFHCISLHDTFWVSEYNSCFSWLDVSPYHNSYSKFISRYSLDGIIGNKDFNCLSPDLSTNGSFPSTWRYISVDNIEFIKGSSKYTLGGISSGNEPYSEYFASLVANYLGFNCVKYKLKNYTRSDGNKDIVTVCKSYTSSGVGSVSASVLGLNSYISVIDYCKNNLDSNSLETVLDMLFLDCILLNTDRHFGNIEFLFDSDTLNILGLAPIFDNNSSLLPRFVVSADTFTREDYFSRTGESFESIFKLISKYKNFTNTLIKLKSFRFVNDKDCSVSKDRLSFLNNLLQLQVSYYLNM